MRKIISFLLSICFVLSACVFSVSSTTLQESTLEVEEKIYCNATIDDDFKEDSIIVVLNKESSKINQRRGLEYFDPELFVSVEDLTSFEKDIDDLELLNKEDFHQIFSLKLKKPGKENVLKAIKILEQKSYIKCVGPNYIYTISPVKSIGTQKEQSETRGVTLNDPRYYNQTELSVISAPAAWEIATGTNTVTVGVMDSGIDRTHVDLINRVNTTLGRNFTDDGLNRFNDETGHGTHVAGIIGAAANNYQGISGVCWDVNMVSLKVFEKGYDENGDITGIGDCEWVAQAINYAIDNEIQILNYSGGGYGVNNELQDALNNYTGLLICAAGNNGRNTDSNPFYPASYTNANVISVAATNDYDNLWQFSNYGATSVDLAAPGEGVLSTLPGNSYASWSGTSMAAPFVTGVAALIKSIAPNFTNTKIKNIILGSVDTLSSLNGKVLTGGRLNAAKALSDTAGLLSKKMVSGDFNGDNKDDIAILTELGNSTFQIHVNTSATNKFNNTAVWYKTTGFSFNKIKDRIAVGDFNGDGMDDIAAMYDHGQQNMSIEVWVSNGTSFTQSRMYDHTTPGWYDATKVTGRFAAGDFNGDGKDDIGWMYDYGQENMSVEVLTSYGTYFTKSRWYDHTTPGWYDATKVTGRFVAGDFNADGKDDLGWMYDLGQQNMAIDVLTSQNTYFTKSRWYDHSTPGWYDATKVTNRFVAGDFNGDGKDDIGWMYDYGELNMAIEVVTSNGTAFAKSRWYDHTTPRWYNTPTVTNKFVAGDFNNDGKCDMSALYTPTNNTVDLQYHVWLSNGSSFPTRSYWY